MAAVALGWFTVQLVWTTICYVNRSLCATAVTEFSRVVHNPG
jgi:hypothetical protein